MDLDEAMAESPGRSHRVLQLVNSGQPHMYQGTKVTTHRPTSQRLFGLHGGQITLSVAWISGGLGVGFGK